ncbi:MAG: response regulator [Myxococcota bacterium]
MLGYEHAWSLSRIEAALAALAVYGFDSCCTPANVGLARVSARMSACAAELQVRLISANFVRWCPEETILMAKKVIVIDDSQTVRQQVRLTLSQAGFEVVEAVDGKDGLAVIQKTKDAAVAICDVNMPHMNGLEMLEALAQTGSKLPVLMLTTEGQPQLIERAKKVGAKGWIVKPFKADLLVAAVKKLAAA